MANAVADFNRKYLSVIVWTLRIVIGATFIVSGLSKAIDIWGFVYKIEEYMNVWGFSQPRSLIVMVALGLSGLEFVAGLLLSTGCYKRSIVWLLLAVMAGMLPLSLYVYMADPVADCGCFGDFVKLSNPATFYKNVVITALLVYFAVYNRKVRGLYGAYVQWLLVAIPSIYVIIIGLVGYNLQPLVDFRSFPVGTSLVSDDEDDDEVNFTFIYEKDGRRESFTQDNLPDSTWQFVDRSISSGKISSATDFVVLDGGDDITSEVIAPEGEELLILIPQYERSDVSATYTINELYKYITERGGSMVGLVATDEKHLEEWRDYSMADYPIYVAEPNLIKEMARGVISVVYLRDGVIKWKRTIASIDADSLAEQASRGVDVFKALAVDGHAVMEFLTLVLVGCMLVLFLLDKSGKLLKWSVRSRQNKRDNNVSV